MVGYLVALWREQYFIRSCLSCREDKDLLALQIWLFDDSFEINVPNISIHYLVMQIDFQGNAS